MVINALEKSEQGRTGRGVREESWWQLLFEIGGQGRLCWWGTVEWNRRRWGVSQTDIWEGTQADRHRQMAWGEGGAWYLLWGFLLWLRCIVMRWYWAEEWCDLAYILKDCFGNCVANTREEEEAWMWVRFCSNSDERLGLWCWQWNGQVLEQLSN